MNTVITDAEIVELIEWADRVKVDAILERWSCPAGEVPEQWRSQLDVPGALLVRVQLRRFISVDLDELSEMQAGVARILRTGQLGMFWSDVDPETVRQVVKPVVVPELPEDLLARPF